MGNNSNIVEEDWKIFQLLRDHYKQLSWWSQDRVETWEDEMRSDNPNPLAAKMYAIDLLLFFKNTFPNNEFGQGDATIHPNLLPHIKSVAESGCSEACELLAIYYEFDQNDPSAAHRYRLAQ